MVDDKNWIERVCVKEGVSLSPLSCEIRIALRTGLYLYEEAGSRFTITSTSDGTHKPGSVHPIGDAFDSRIWGLTSLEIDFIVEEAGRQLGIHYDIIKEPSHIHWEYDFKKRYV